MILAVCTSQKTQGTTVRCVKTPRVQEARASCKKAQKNLKKRAFLGLLVITLGTERKKPQSVSLVAPRA
ncbi:hypothetical protein HanPI659440_Chr01g0031601 [Helianthus annuus]|nr:hypothetical protein HanPI659440_Chr01g0031601 [Helianthus annuus]